MTKEEAIAILEAYEGASEKLKLIQDLLGVEFKEENLTLPSAKLNNPCNSLLTDESNGSKEHKSKLDHDRDWIIGCIEHDGFIHTHRFDKANHIILEALQDRPTGRWIDYSDEGYVECPFCHSATNCDGNKDELHFCFSCGAKMEGGDDE